MAQFARLHSEIAAYAASLEALPPGCRTDEPATLTAGRQYGNLYGSAAVEREVRRLVAQGRIRDARALLDWAVRAYPGSTSLARWQRDLAPAKVRLGQGPTVAPRDREAAWLRQHRHEYRGMWVALKGDVLVTAGRDLQEVIQSIRHRDDAPEVLLHFVPPEDEQ